MTTETRFKLSDTGKLSLDDFVKNNASFVYIDGKQFAFIPFWIERDGEDVFLHSLGSLPDCLKQYIENDRNIAK